MAAFLLLYTLAAYGQQRPEAKEVAIEKKLIEGKKYTLLGDWEKAEAMYRAILDEDVQNSAACYELSRTLAAAGKYDDALAYIRRANRIEPDNEWYILMEADIHERRGDIHSTMEMYDRLIALRPAKTHYYEAQIEFCRRTDEHQRLLSILDAYENVIGIGPSSTRTRFETLDAMGKKEEALAALVRLTEIFPTNIEYKFLAASYARQSGNETAAIDLYKAILALEPDNSRAKLALAGSEKKAGGDAAYLFSILPVIKNPALDIDVKLQELIPYVVRLSETKDAALGQALQDIAGELVQAHPKEAKSHAIQGDILSITGDYPEAIAAYMQSVSISGSVYAVWEQLLFLLITERSYDELIRQAHKAQDYFPNQGFLYYAAGYGAFRKRQYDDALEWLNEALVMSGRNTGQKISVFNILGLVYDELGDLEKSSLAFETALELDPKRAETLAYYSLALSRRISQSEKAIMMTEKALGQETLPEALHEILAEALFSQRKYAQAWTSVQKAMAAYPHGDTYNLAGDILLKLEKPEEAVAMWELALEKGCSDPEVKRKIAGVKTP